MSHDVKPALSVSIRERNPIRVAFVDLAAEFEPGEFSSKIRAQFQSLRQWIEEQGLDPDLLLHIGIPKATAGQLAGYECCLEAPEAILGEPGRVEIKELPGGCYAVLKVDKDPESIGQALDRFYSEFVPQEELELDGQRPTLEIYYENWMEYCAPLVKGCVQ